MVATRHCLLLLVLVLISFSAQAQQCGSCKASLSVAQYDLEVQVPQPELKGDSTKGWLEWLQLFWLSKYSNDYLFASNKNCVRFTQPLSAEASNESFTSGDGIEVVPLIEESEIVKVGMTYTNLPLPGDVSRFGNYLIGGSVTQSGNGYLMQLELQTSCSRKTVASTSVSFQFSGSSEYMRGIAHQAASQLSPLIDKIKQFELKQRKDSDIISLDGDSGESIAIKPKKRSLAAGEQTELEIILKDCDDHPLPNRKIVFTKGTLNGAAISAGTVGGTVTPSTVITDANGKAKASFKMGNDKKAIIDAWHLYQKPYGCEGIKMGSTTIGTTPIKVEITYFQNETKTLKRATLPGVKVEGGHEVEQTTVAHTTILYYYPSGKDLKEGLIVNASKDNTENTKYVTETGYFSYTKHVQDAKIRAGVGIEVHAVEEGSQTNYSGTASLQHQSEVMFHLGDAITPAGFMWAIEYPVSNDGIAFAGVGFAKGDDGVEWIVKKITDPASPYKTEYTLKQKLDAAEELKKGNRAMKDLFGLDLDGMTKMIDPTNPQQNMAGASGSQQVIVRILAPY